MHKTMEHCEKLCELEKKLSSWFEDEIAKGSHCFDVSIGKEVTDMIKDLAEAQEKLWKACYYKKITEAMDEYKDFDEDFPMDEEGRRGYDNWRYASGRFAPTGHGHRSGYRGSGTMRHRSGSMHNRMRGYDDGMDYDDDNMYDDRRGMPRRNMRGYVDEYDMDGMHDPNRQNGMHDTMPMRPWDRYTEAKRHYTETKDQSHKDAMEKHADEHIHESIDSMKEMWKDASPNLRAKLKTQLTSLVNTMN